MITGAILGGVGSLLNRGLSIFENHQKAKIDEKRRSDDFEMAKLKGAADALVESYKHDVSLSANNAQWVNNIRALVRPTLTAYSLGLVTLFYFLGSVEDKALLVAMAADLATMTVTWWFADRFKK